MIKHKWILPVLFSLVIMVAFSAFQKTPSNGDEVNDKPQTEYYFKFDGVPGEEYQENKWIELEDIDDYLAQACEGEINGCVLITESKTGNHPTEVPVTGTGSLMTPVATGSVTEVRNLN